MSKTYTFKFENGKIKSSADGFKDASCLAFLEKLEEIFGKAESVEKKQEANNVVTEQEHTRKA